tara:strand:- start:981 stop:2090 length:1110 start_codon:yes stop_codon:yes gene_type:complete
LEQLILQRLPSSLQRSLGTGFAEVVMEFLASGASPSAIVGGWLRDLALGRDPGDVDLVSAQPDALKQRLLAAGARKAVLLDPMRRTWRVVLERDVFVDVTLLQGLGSDPLVADLGLRDLRVNALAWNPLSGLLDPFSGLQDLNEGRLRAVSDRSMADDPLRALRACRIAEQLGMQLAPELLRQMAGLSLQQVGRERCVAELRQILLQPFAARPLRQLDELGLLAQQLPEPFDLQAYARVEGRQFTTAALKRCMEAVYAGGEAWRIGLRLSWLLSSERVDLKLRARRWPRRIARLAGLGELRQRRLVAELDAQTLEQDLRRWKDAACVALLTSVRDLADEEAEQWVRAYLTVLGGRAMGGALTRQKGWEA